MRPIMRKCFRHIKDESGVALVTGLVILVGLTAIGTYAINVTQVELATSANLKTSKQAFYVAEAGLHHAKSVLNQNTANWNTYASSTPQTLLATTAFNGIGHYTVTVQDAGGGARRLRSTGTTTSQASAVLETLVRLGPYTPGSAVTVGGNLEVKGNPTIAGTHGGVHTNSNLEISGSPAISGNATAAGTYSVSGSPVILGTAGGSQPTVTIPNINPLDFFGARDYRLAADGKVYNASGVEQPMPGGTWNGWDYSGGKWTLNSNSTIDGTLYIEGDAKISGNPGSTSSPWIITLIATGTIEVAGNPKMRPPATTDSGGLFRTGTENLLFVAGRDLKITGTPQQSFQGILAAHEQVSVKGNATITGFILAQDAGQAGTLVTKDDLNGNMTLTYNGGLSNPFPGDVQVMSWELGS